MMITAGRSTLHFDVNAQNVGVQETLPHENYYLDRNGVQAYNDVGLLLLDPPFKFNSYVQPIELTNVIDFQKPVFIYGWGSTNAFHNMPFYQLRTKNTSLILENSCIDMLNKAIHKYNKQVYELCTQKSVCRGDSGSPMVQTVGDVTKLIGIGSWIADDHINCDTAPAIFENIGYFSEWIKNGIRALLKERVSENIVDQENLMS